MRISIPVVFAVFSVVLTSPGCTQSLQVKYEPGLSTGGAQIPGDISLGVGELTDRRHWAEAGNEKSASFVSQQGFWKYGVTYRGEAYTPIAEVVQDLLVTELNSAGVSARKVTGLAGGGTPAAYQDVATREDVDYVLGGEIQAFEFYNDTQGLLVTSRQNVTLALSLVKRDGSKIFWREAFTDGQQRNEGMIVAFSTNMDTLFNKVFKRVVEQVVEKLSGDLAGGDVELRVKFACGDDEREYIAVAGADPVSLVPVSPLGR